MSDALQKALAYAQENRERFLSELKEIVSIPSVSMQDEHAEDLVRATGLTPRRTRAQVVADELLVTLSAVSQPRGSQPTESVVELRPAPRRRATPTKAKATKTAATKTAAAKTGSAKTTKKTSSTKKKKATARKPARRKG